MITKQEIIDIVDKLDFNELRKLGFSTYTHEIFAFCSIIPFMQYGMNSYLNTFSYTFFSVLFSIFLISYIHKNIVLKQNKVFQIQYLVLEIIFYIIFFASIFIYASFCINNTVNKIEHSIYSTYDLFFFIPIIIIYYVAGILIYNYKYYVIICAKRFKKLYEAMKAQKRDTKTSLKDD